ncbi:MAG: ATP phosphoribosyltransferase regulatory subunit [Anaerolineae bacterium]
MILPTLSRPPGFYDRLGLESAAVSDLTQKLADLIARFGYQVVETPLVEHADVFLTKSGDEAVSRLFTFEIHGRTLCLRSEFTPSAVRLYVERFQHEPKPLRWQFAGPVFRYESPGLGNSRQFTMLGAELIGAAGAGGDAEVIGMAAYALQTIGVTNWSLSVGHVGLTGALLDGFGLDRRVRRYMLGQVENLRRPNRGRAFVEAELAKLYSGIPEQLPNGAPLPISALTEDTERFGQALHMLLESADLGSTGKGRSSEDIARRLLAKQRRFGQREQIGRALDFLEQLVHLEGPPKQVLPALENLIPSDNAVASETFRTFRAALDLLPAYGISQEQLKVQMGMARGLNYYTGIVFELYDQQGAQLCGGGRYDELIRVLGAAQDTPAVGLAFGVERIATALGLDAVDAMPRETVAALIVPLDESDDFVAAQTAMALRIHGRVEVFAPPTRNLSQVLARANRRGTPFVILIGADERASGHLTVKDMRARTQTSATLQDVAALIAEVSSNAQ